MLLPPSSRRTLRALLKGRLLRCTIAMMASSRHLLFARDQRKMTARRTDPYGVTRAVHEFPTGRRAADAGRHVPRRDDERRGGARGHRARPVRRSAGSAALGRLPRPRQPAVLRHGLRLRCLGPAVRRAAAEGTASVPGDPRPASRRLDAGRHPLPHPLHAHGSVLRTGDADHGAARRRRRRRPTRCTASSISTTAT